MKLEIGLSLFAGFLLILGGATILATMDALRDYFDLSAWWIPILGVVSVLVATVGILFLLLAQVLAEAHVELEEMEG